MEFLSVLLVFTVCIKKITDSKYKPCRNYPKGIIGYSMVLCC